MKRNVKIRVADSAGNITIFVLDRTDRSEYASLAGRLLDMPELRGEQVAFVTGPKSMEMCGLEFCGNASRAFALMCAEKMNISDASSGEVRVIVNVSGAEDEIEARVRPAEGYVSIDMPLPIGVSEFEACDVKGTLVDFGGIAHLVLCGRDADDELFDRLKDSIAERLDPPALGVMFCSEEMVTPIVYVKDVDSIYHEGSCASGATAVAIAESRHKPGGEYSSKLKMPAGILDVGVTTRSGKVEAVTIGSAVTISDPFTVETK